MFSPNLKESTKRIINYRMRTNLTNNWTWLSEFWKNSKFSKLQIKSWNVLSKYNQTVTQVFDIWKLTDMTKSKTLRNLMASWESTLEVKTIFIEYSMTNCRETYNQVTILVMIFFNWPSLGLKKAKNVKSLWLSILLYSAKANKTF